MLDATTSPDVPSSSPPPPGGAVACCIRQGSNNASTLFTSRMLAGNEPQRKLAQIAKENQISLLEFDFAELMDKKDPCRHLRNEFFYPKMKTLPPFVDLGLVHPEDDAIYLCGNSLGLEPKGARAYIDTELKKWADMGVIGHNIGDLPWALCDEAAIAGTAKLTGAKNKEIAIMNGLSVNLHLLLISFYRPNKSRYKILLEAKAFPSDHYIIQSQIRLHGLDPAECMLCLKRAEIGDASLSLRTEDILETLRKEGDKIAVVLFSGVHYYTGQYFNIPEITKFAQEKGCYVGWDLAHAIGNVPLKLHEWNVDFAAWCTYKYLNSGAGGIAGVFIHERYETNDFPRLTGWWSHKYESRFQMDNVMDLDVGPAGYRISNPPPLLVCTLLASLDVFEKTTMEELRAKSVLLTTYLEFLIEHFFSVNSEYRVTRAYCQILTPKDPEQRGSQLSLEFSVNLDAVFQELLKRGVVCDRRLPYVIRISPVPLYNSFSDVRKFCDALQESLAATGDY